MARSLLVAVTLGTGVVASAYFATSRFEGTPAASAARAGSSAAIAQKRSAAVRSSQRRPQRSEPATSEVARVRATLADGVRRARALGGRVQAAVWLDGWPAPVAIGDDLSKPMRMWSMAKPIEAIAALRVSARRRVRLTAGFASAMQRALRRSENCSARRMVLELEQLSAGPAGARVAFAAVLRDAGAHVTVASQEDGAADQSADCRAFLGRERSGLVEPDGDAVLFGTSLWTVGDAVRFAHALAGGRYGAAGATVLATLAKPKRMSAERGAILTAGALWGAGIGFRGFPVAYKAGWGGTRQGAFLAGQFVIVDLGGRRGVVAAMFHPDKQPLLDDPGETPAPRALEEIFASVSTAFRRVRRAHR